ncbi:uncharacterized protein LOC126792665 [Argentina anserina]|uniref:uncharacterized protein LOC126792665 n=1 Tax=Argentina anserina TaxID=57926 RepID=UPI00217683B9|nr:uncharacterized protein LOC126792665 [Potentilla anserina]
MGTEILRPQDCLIDRVRLPTSSTSSFSRPRSYSNGPIPVQQQHRRFGKPAVRSEQQKPEPAAVVSKRSGGRASSDDLMKAEKVTILRRGEPLRRIKKAASDGRLERLSPGPTVVPKEVRIVDLRTPVTDMYAGSAFAMSPEPSSLPLPSFSGKKKQVSRSFDDSATRDLRRLLRLE